MEILLVSLGVLASFFLIAYVRLFRKFLAVSKAFADLYIATLEFDETVENISTNKTDSDIHKDNFIKFLSDSREWAFTYIDDVQKGLQKFIEEVEPHVEYYKNYGLAVEGMVAPHDFALKTISKEFEQLKKLLPEEIDDRR